MVFALSFLYWDTAVAAALLTMLQGPEWPGGFLPFLPWLGCSWAGYLALRLFLRRERSFNAAAALMGALTLAQMGLLVWALNPDHGTQALGMSALCVGYTAARSFQYCFEPPIPDRLPGRFEASLLFLGFGLLVAAAREYGELWLWPLFSAGLLALFSLILTRVFGREVLAANPRGAALALTASLLLVGLVTVLAAGLWGLPYEAGPRALLLALARAGVFLANCLNRLITFLASLIPPVPDGGWEPEPIETPQLGGGEELPPDSGPVLAVILLLAILAGLGYLLWKMRFAKLRLGGRTLGRQKPRRQRGRFLPALAAAWARLVRRVRLALALWKGRDTPAGLYCWLSRKNARRPALRLRPGETPAEYLDRLARACPEAAGQLGELSGRLCAQWYGGQPPAPFGGRPLRRAWAAYLRRGGKKAG